MKAYHGVLQQLGVKPHRSLEDDMKLQTNVMSYGGNGKVVSVPESPLVATRGLEAAKKDCGCGCNGAGTCAPRTAAAERQRPPRLHEDDAGTESRLPQGALGPHPWLRLPSVLSP